MKNLTKIFSIGVFALFLGLNTVSAQEKKAGDGVQFFKGPWEAALKMSKESGKPIFVDAYTSWCGPCKWMNANVFPKKSVGEYYNKNFINVKMDMEKGQGPKVAQTYRVMAYPTLLFIDGEGKVIHRSMGMKNVEQFIDLGKAAVQAGKS